MADEICRKPGTGEVFGIQGTGMTGDALGCRPEHAVSLMRRRLGWTLFRTRFLPVGSAAFFACGLIILGGRLLEKNWTPLYSTVLIAVAAATALGIAACKVWRVLPDRRKLLVYLEGSVGNSGGLLSAGLEVDLGPWRERIGLIPLPRLRGRVKYSGLAFLAGAVFVGGALWCPVRHFEPKTQVSLHIDDEVAEVLEKLEVIEQETLASADEVTEIRNTVGELQENNDAGNAGRTYELLEKLSRRVEGLGENAAGKLRESTENLTMLSSAMNTLAGLPSDSPLSGEISAELANAMKKLAETNPELAELMKQAAASGMNMNRPDPETMRKLAESMKSMSKEMREKLARMIEAKLTKRKSCSSGKCGKDGYVVDQEALSEWLKQQGMEAACMGIGCGIPGKGGVGRGRADAELDLSGNTQDDGGKRRSMQAEGGTDPEQSVVLATFAGPPDPNEEKRAAAAGRLKGGDTALEHRRTRILPEHRAVVEQYFKTKSKQE